MNALRRVDVGIEPYEGCGGKTGCHAKIFGHSEEGEARRENPPVKTYNGGLPRQFANWLAMTRWNPPAPNSVRKSVKLVIPSERSESRDPGTELTANEDQMRRFLDSLRLLGMT